MSVLVRTGTVQLSSGGLQLSRSLPNKIARPEFTLCLRSLSVRDHSRPRASVKGVDDGFVEVQVQLLHHVGRRVHEAVHNSWDCLLEEVLWVGVSVMSASVR